MVEKKESPKREEPKFIGGASGPMEVKKLAGLGTKPKPPEVKKPTASSGGGFDFDYFSGESVKQ